MQQIRRLQHQSALRPAVAPQPVNNVVKTCDGETLYDLARKIAARIG
ncbi:hypothetical protein O5621_03730 [Escherichia coli]|nr:hypothetical protein [Escherichia coli]